MNFANSDVLLSFMSFKVLKGILKREKEFIWLSKEVTRTYNRVQAIISIGSEKEVKERKIKEAIQNVIFSEPFVGLLFIDKSVSSAEEAIQVSYNYLLNVYKIYVKRIPSTTEFNIYKYLKYVDSSNLYDVSNFELKRKINKYKNTNYNNGNIEKSTLVILSYLEKYYKNYYL